MQDRRPAKATLLSLVLTLLLYPCGIAVATDAKVQEPPYPPPASPPGLSQETRGDLLMIHHQYLEAIDAYRKAEPSAVVWNKLGIAYHHVYALDQAKMDYEQALILRPKYPEAMNNLGAVYYGEKDYKRAVKLYRHSLKLDPRSAPAYSNLGTAYFAEGKIKQGMTAYRAAFAIDPSVFAGDVDQTIPETSSTAERAWLDFSLAEIFAQAGIEDRAIEFLRKAINEGFSDSKRLMQEPQFAKLRKTPEFAELMAAEKMP